MKPVRFSSSLRERDAAETLAIAKALAPSLGITRVTEITALDRIGLPVFVSIRPDAELGSVCVNAGKGLRAIEAETGATMEALELAWAEYRRCHATVPIELARVGDFDTASEFQITDYSPVWGTALDLDAEIACVRAEDLVSGSRGLVPAEAVIHPLPPAIGGVRYFGTHSNGLASGNSIGEATVHALCEVLERDVLSFHALVRAPKRVRPESLPDSIRSTLEQLDARNFRLVVCWLPNELGLPAFTAVIYDRDQPHLSSPGDGLHPVREIALVRAVVETAQARLAQIHGGRDDLVEVFARYEHLGVDGKSELFERRLADLEKLEVIEYDQIPDHECPDLASAYAILKAAVADNLATPIWRVVYTPADYPVSVVRVVVPRAELYTPETRRIGPRLLQAIRR